MDVAAGCCGVAEKPPKPVVPAGLAAPKAVVPAWPNMVVLAVPALAPKTEVLAWGWKPAKERKCDYDGEWYMIWVSSLPANPVCGAAWV